MIASERLIAALPQATQRNWGPAEVAGVTSDSRRVRPGDLFVAVPGVQVDGHRFVGQALAAGAVGCVLERPVPEAEGAPTLLVPDAREALAYLHAALCGHPGRSLVVVGVTGTDGKTTTCRLVASILRAAGLRVGVIDTVAAEIGGRPVETGLHTTTPDAEDVQALLAAMVAEGDTHAVLESTSHGLAQHRVTAAEFDVAVVTNITHEHLDYHGSYAAYREAKAMLFRALGTAARKPGVPKVAVLNADDAAYDYLRAIPAEVRVAYSLRGPADVAATRVEVSGQGLALEVAVDGRRLTLRSPLVGRYNAANVLAAVATAHGLGLPSEAMVAGVATVQAVVGRMERVDLGQPFAAIVDFAHTPYALESALDTARELATGRVIAVFGCAGLRDRAKRPWMGEIAGRLADHTIITAEDPRTEPLEAIMAEIAAGCERAGAHEGEGYRRVGDRGQAIAEALAMAQPGDVVLVCGKGHERSMCYGTVEHPWSDQEAVRQGLQALGWG